MSDETREAAWQDYLAKHSENWPLPGLIWLAGWDARDGECAEKDARIAELERETWALSEQLLNAEADLSDSCEENVRWARMILGGRDATRERE